MIASLSHADLTQEMAGHFQGDFAELQANVNGAMLTLRSTMGGILTTAGTITGNSRELSAAADQLARARDVSTELEIAPSDALPILHQLLDEVRIRPPFGGHPRVFIWGLLEARLQQADLMILGGLNEGVWPALPTPDPWLAPKIRSNLGGIRDLNRLPEAIVMVDPSKEKNAVAEARGLGIKIVALIDTDSNPDSVDLAIPGNDDSIRSIRLITGYISDAIKSGRSAIVQKQQETVKAEEYKAVPNVR